jgi:uncharacterized membrane protein YozB (DUF420 family)
VKHATTLRAVLLIAFWLLGVKILLAILVEYRFYFPANFDTAFLVGREDIFAGAYRAAFYIHIVVGPVCLVFAAILLASGSSLSDSESRMISRRRCSQMHRRLGRLQALLVLGLLLPTGLVMSTHAFAGPIAVAAFATLSITTAIAVIAAIITAMQGKVTRHRRWAMRTLLLLASPLLLRFMSGLLAASGWESDRTYQLNAWSSWLVPLIVFELSRLRVSKVTPKVAASITGSTHLPGAR